MIDLSSVKRDMVMAHPTFCCPITKEILDYRSVHIIKFTVNNHKKTDIIKFTVNNHKKTDIISHNGYDLLIKNKPDLFASLGLTIVENLEDL